MSHLSLLFIHACNSKKKQNEQDAECPGKEQSCHHHQRPAGQMFILAHIIASDYTSANILAGVQAAVNVISKKKKKPKHWH